jgi:hypothetical protein
MDATLAVQRIGRFNRLKIGDASRGIIATFA